MKIFGVIWQFLKNGALWADKGVNLFTGGDPNETFSKRLGRARRAGAKPACFVCSFLTALFNPIALVKGNTVQNHCEYALTPGPSIAAEIWHWPTSDTPNPTLDKL
jgi:hypothetical protein